MKRTHTAPVAALALSLLLVLSACSAPAATAPSAPAASMPASSAGDSKWSEEMGFTNDAATPAPMAPGGGQGGAVYRDADVKLIRRATLSMATESFDQALAGLEALVAEVEGYFESANVNSGGYWEKNALRSGDYTIRVPAAAYDVFMDRAGALAHVNGRSESTEDVGAVYYDTEAQLKALRIKQDRLLALLEKAATMEDIISLENALGDTEYQIEQLSSDLRRYDGLVSYATIQLQLSEVLRVEDQPGDAAPLPQRIGAGLSASFRGLLSGLEGLILGISYHFFTLLIVGTVLGIAGRYAWRKGTGKRKTQDPDKKDETH